MTLPIRRVLIEIGYRPGEGGEDCGYFSEFVKIIAVKLLRAEDLKLGTS